jgi:hypothetical protein
VTSAYVTARLREFCASAVTIIRGMTAEHRANLIAHDIIPETPLTVTRR